MAKSKGGNNQGSGRSKAGKNLPSTTGRSSGKNKDNLPPRPGKTPPPAPKGK